MTKHQIRNVFPESLPDDYKAHAYKHMRRELGNNLLDMLEEQNSRCLVEINETREPAGKDEDGLYSHLPAEAVTLSVKLTNPVYDRIAVLPDLPLGYVKENVSLEAWRGIIGMVLIIVAIIGVIVFFG